MTLSLNSDKPTPARRRTDYVILEILPIPKAMVELIFGAPIPMELVHDEHFQIMAAAVTQFGGNWKKAALDIKAQLGRETRVQMRALRINLARMRQEGGYPWAA